MKFKVILSLNRLPEWKYMDIFTKMAAKRQSGTNSINKIVNEYGKKLFGFIRNRVPNNADAEDILQEVWYQLSRVVDVDSIDQLSGWLFQVARNKVTDNYRKKKDDFIEDFTYENDEGEEFNFKDLLMADSPSPEEENLKELFWKNCLRLWTNYPKINARFLYGTNWKTKLFRKFQTGPALI